MSKQDTRPKAAKALAAVTDKEEAEFAPDLDEYPFPDPDDLEEIPAEEFYDE